MSKNITGKMPYSKPLSVEQLLAMPEEDIAYDDDCPATDGAFWEGAVIKKGSEVIGRTPRGKQKAPTKQATTVRLDVEVLEAFRATGKGWQTRMNNALKEWLAAH